ncbi:hypothetical protein BIV25_38800 [Streptomyces sp. MUSC 14]|nr:hypothetical protein BIV25_38800 [Streptomyces sp. MUSC 14]
MWRYPPTHPLHHPELQVSGIRRSRYASPSAGLSTAPSPRADRGRARFRAQRGEDEDHQAGGGHIQG